MKPAQRMIVVVASAALTVGALAACTPGTIVDAGTETPPPQPTDIAASTPTPDPVPVFVAPADCHVMAGADLEADFASRDIVLFNSTNGEGEFAFDAPVTKQGPNAFSCVWGVPFVDLNSFGLETQGLTQEAHEGVVAVLGAGGFDMSIDGNVVTYTKVGAETGDPADQTEIHILHPDGWITAWSSFGGPVMVDRLSGYLVEVTKQVYPAP